MYTIIFVDPTVESLNKAKFGIDYIEIPQIGLPEELEMTVKVNHEDDSVLNLRGRCEAGQPGLREYTLELHFPMTALIVLSTILTFAVST